MNTITPSSKLQEIKKLNEQIPKQFEDGITGLGHKDFITGWLNRLYMFLSATWNTKLNMMAEII
jgi:hypothetical protein